MILSYCRTIKQAGKEGNGWSGAIPSWSARSELRLFGQPQVFVVRCRMEKIRIEQHSSVGLLWIAGWLFTIGYLKLAFWQGVLALAIWPYYLGAAFSSAAGS